MKLIINDGNRFPMNNNQYPYKVNSPYDSKIKWYNKQDVLSIFPITERTYFRRIKNLPETIRTQVRKNKKGKPSLYIHYQDLSQVFHLRRNPKCSNDPTMMRKYIGTKDWNFIGNIIPKGSTLNDLEYKMNFLFEKLNLEDNKTELFYSCELNTEDENFHAHFLINTNLKRNQILEILKLICDENNKKESRINLMKYDYETYHYSGSFYSFKTSENEKGISLLENYLKFKTQP